MFFKKSIQHIITGCKRREPKYQRLLVDEYSDMLYALCIRYMGDREEAKDLLQISLTKIFQNIEKYESGKGGPESWMSTIAINSCLTALRSQRSFVSIDDHVLQISSQDTNAIDELSNEELLNLISELPTIYREVFNLYVIDGYTHDEIGKLLDIEASLSRTRLTRSKILLRQAISRINEEESWVKLA